MKEKERTYRICKGFAKLSKPEREVFDFLWDNDFDGGYGQITKAMGLKPQSLSNVRKTILSLEERKLVCVIVDRDNGVYKSIKGFFIVDNWEEILMKL